MGNPHCGNGFLHRFVVVRFQPAEKAGVRLPPQCNQLINSQSAGLCFIRQHHTYFTGALPLTICRQRLSLAKQFPCQGRLEESKRAQQGRFSGSVRS